MSCEGNLNVRNPVDLRIPATNFREQSRIEAMIEQEESEIQSCKI
jgi:hypothetical protein